jgi:hypothetical protein
VNKLDDKLQESALLGRAAEGDRLLLADDTMQRALDGSRALTLAERAALAASPVTLRRFRTLALQRKARAQAANDASWAGSAGLLRAAAAGDLARLVTDDGWWSIDFLPHDGGWQAILRLEPAAPFAGRLLGERPLVRVTDGAGAVVLQERLDADGECEGEWPFATAPAQHFQAAGARFAVQPALGEA